MSERLWAGITTGGTTTRVLVSAGTTTVLKARLSSTPSHPRALQWLLEAVALWQGQPVRAVLCVDSSGPSYEPALRRDWFPDFGHPLYSIEWTDRARPRKREDKLGGLGDFRDLKQLHFFDALDADGR